MLIKYQPKQDHVKCVPLIPVTPEQKKFKLTRSQIQLLPGTNEVTDNEWEIMKSHLSNEITRKEIAIIEKVVAKSKKFPDGGKAHDLRNMPASEAVSLVAACVNPDTLNKWYKEEVREEVRLAVVEKMKELKMEIPKFSSGAGTGDDDTETAENNDGKKNIEEMTVAELKAYAAENNITVSGSKEEILAAIKEAEEE